MPRSEKWHLLIPYLLNETENKIVDDILALLNRHGQTSQPSISLLERLDGIIEIGQRVAKGTTHYLIARAFVQRTLIGYKQRPVRSCGYPLKTDNVGTSCA